MLTHLIGSSLLKLGPQHFVERDIDHYHLLKIFPGGRFQPRPSASVDDILLDLPSQSFISYSAYYGKRVYT